MRGRQKFNQIFEDNTTTTVEATKSRGRSKERHNRRNEMMIDRYYFYARLLRLRYPDVTEKIDAEFCIAPLTIAEIIEEKESYLASLKKDNISLKQLQTKWPHLNWKMDGKEAVN